MSHTRVGDEDVWERVVECDVAAVEAVLVAFAAAGCEGDWGAVHVHFAVAEIVEPCPGEDCSTGWQAGGDCEGVGEWIRCVGSSLQVTWRVLGWATTLDGVDDLESAVGCRSFIVGDGDLT